MGGVGVEAVLWISASIPASGLASGDLQTPEVIGTTRVIARSAAAEAGLTAPLSSSLWPPLLLMCHDVTNVITGAAHSPLTTGHICHPGHPGPGVKFRDQSDVPLFSAPGRAVVGTKLVLLSLVMSPSPSSSHSPGLAWSALKLPWAGAVLSPAALCHTNL